MQTAVQQRLRVTFGVADPLIYASVLDLGRLWERLLRRARAPLAYTQGFNPHPRLQFAAALPVGYGSECELVDILLAECLTPECFRQSVAPQLPPGLSIEQVEEIPLDAPSPQATMREAHYRVSLTAPVPAEQVRQSLDSLVARQEIIRERPKKGELKPYDLRPLVLALELCSSNDTHHELFMRLLCSAQGSGRPEEVVDELGLPLTDFAIRRCRLVWGTAQEG